MAVDGRVLASGSVPPRAHVKLKDGVKAVQVVHLEKVWHDLGRVRRLFLGQLCWDLDDLEVCLATFRCHQP